MTFHLHDADNTHPDSDPKHFFEDARGVSRKVRLARPYEWWDQGDAGFVARLVETFGMHRSHCTRIVNQSPGWLIMRWPASNCAALTPELRPLYPVRLAPPKIHWHGDGPEPAGLDPWQRMPGPREEWQEHIDKAERADLDDDLGELVVGELLERLLTVLHERRPSGMSPRDVQAVNVLLPEVGDIKVDDLTSRHLDDLNRCLTGTDNEWVTKRSRAIFEAILSRKRFRILDQNLHGLLGPDGKPIRNGGRNTEELHRHQDYAKYVFDPADLYDDYYPHDHARESKRIPTSKLPGIASAHLANEHAGVERVGVHYHVKQKKDHGSSDAARLDVHPMALQAITNAEVVFFVIEGCIKADAVLSAGGAVFSVPSVSMWLCDELEGFADRFLKDKAVVIVNDNDWVNNRLVINQSRLCQVYLQRRGVVESYVAAPPQLYAGKSYKGVDDFLGAGGLLDDLVVISADPPGNLDDVVERLASENGRRRSDGINSDKRMARWLSFFSPDDGIFKPSLTFAARVLGTYPKDVIRAVDRLTQLGAITTSGVVATKVDYFSRQEAWKNRKKRPVIELIPELRSVSRQATLAETLGADRSLRWREVPLGRSVA